MAINPAEVVRLVVTGGRDYSDKARVHRVLFALLRKLGSPKKLFVINGGATGADRLVEDWCLKHGVPCVRMPAHWDFYGPKAAGPVRNQWMIDYLMPTHGLVFPGGRGTADMHQRMKRAHLKIKELK